MVAGIRCLPVGFLLLPVPEQVGLGVVALVDEQEFRSRGRHQVDVVALVRHPPPVGHGDREAGPVAERVVTSGDDGRTQRGPAPRTASAMTAGLWAGRKTRDWAAAECEDAGRPGRATRVRRGQSRVMAGQDHGHDYAGHQGEHHGGGQYQGELLAMRCRARGCGFLQPRPGGRVREDLGSGPTGEGGGAGPIREGTGAGVAGQVRAGCSSSASGPGCSGTLSGSGSSARASGPGCSGRAPPPAAPGGRPSLAAPGGR